MIRDTSVRTKLTLVSGAEAWRWLADQAFLDEWRGMWERCSWAGPFQSPAFVTTWYQIYRMSHDPILVVSRDERGSLDGLLTLARVTPGVELVVAGAHQAEYQVWICTAERADRFAAEAFTLLRRRFPSLTLRLSYLPPQTPLGWLDEGGHRGHAVLTSWRRPLLALGAGGDSLRKPGNRSRLRQLRKLGPVEFRRVIEPSEFRPLLEQLVNFHDARQSASHGSTPFRNDTKKQEFHQALFESSGLLHASVLRAGERVVSIHLNMIRRSEVQLFLIAHDPSLEHYSPGKLHIRFLEQMLIQEGYARLDLTPGGESYKERFANDADEVHSLAIYPTRMRRAVALGITSVEQSTKAMLVRMNLKPASVAHLARKASSLDVAGAIRRALF